MAVDMPEKPHAWATLCRSLPSPLHLHSHVLYAIHTVIPLIKGIFVTGMPQNFTDEAEEVAFWTWRNSAAMNISLLPMAMISIMAPLLSYVTDFYFNLFYAFLPIALLITFTPCLSPLLADWWKPVAPITSAILLQMTPHGSTSSIQITADVIVHASLLFSGTLPLRRSACFTGAYMGIRLFFHLLASRPPGASFAPVFCSHAALWLTLVVLSSWLESWDRNTYQCLTRLKKLCIALAEQGPQACEAFDCGTSPNAVTSVIEAIQQNFVIHPFPSKHIPEVDKLPTAAARIPTYTPCSPPPALQSKPGTVLLCKLVLDATECEELQAQSNVFLSEVTAAASTFYGTIHHITADTVAMSWNLFHFHPTPQSQACYCALDIQKRLKATLGRPCQSVVTCSWFVCGIMPTPLGQIPVVHGQWAHATHRLSRLHSLLNCDILITGEVYDALRGRFATLPLDYVQPEGLGHGVLIHGLFPRNPFVAPDDDLHDYQAGFVSLVQGDFIAAEDHFTQFLKHAGLDTAPHGQRLLHIALNAQLQRGSVFCRHDGWVMDNLGEILITPSETPPSISSSPKALHTPPPEPTGPDQEPVKRIVHFRAQQPVRYISPSFKGSFGHHHKGAPAVLLPSTECNPAFHPPPPLEPIPSEMSLKDTLATFTIGHDGSLGSPIDSFKMSSFGGSPTRYASSVQGGKMSPPHSPNRLGSRSPMSLHGSPLAQRASPSLQRGSPTLQRGFASMRRGPKENWNGSPVARHGMAPHDGPSGSPMGSFRILPNSSFCKPRGIIVESSSGSLRPQLSFSRNLLDGYGFGSFRLPAEARRRRLSRWSAGTDSTVAAEDEEPDDTNPIGNAIVFQTTTRTGKKCLWYCSETLLGAGGFGGVFLGMSEDGVLVAIKQMEIGPEKNSQLRNEVKILSKFQNNNIVAYLGSAVVGKHVMVVMEYAPTSLAKVIHNFGKLSEPCTKRYTKDIVRGLAYLHANQVIHRDIKPQNVLIGQRGFCKLADFGTASLLNKLEQGGDTVIGTPHYMAPEMLHGQIGSEADIWALGVTVWEMLTGQLLDNCQEMTNVAAIMFHLGMMTEAPQIPHEFSDAVKEFLRLCLCVEPAQRATTEVLLRLPLFA